MTRSLYLYPNPRSLQLLGGTAALSQSVSFQLEGGEELQAHVNQRIAAAFQSLRALTAPLPVTSVTIRYCKDLHKQGYTLEIVDHTVTLCYSAAPGLNYAVISLEQLLRRYSNELPNCRIEDEPEFEVRGVMLDIGRTKIPQLDTLFSLIDKLASLKINHLQLYMEGYCFEYEKYKTLFPDETPVTADEFRQLDTYAKERYIDLVPNQNCFGHMAPWLAKEEFRELAENLEGISINPAFSMPASTLNPLAPGSIELVADLFHELLPNFSSPYVNINMDEPFELGTGKSKERADETGIGNLYMEFAGKVFDIIRKHGKKTLMWGDILIKHPEVIASLPEDVTVLDWNYESSLSFERHCQLLRESGVSFYVCPGTSSWTTISGRTDNMLENIYNAAINGKKYGAGGLIVTDWGDMGHWQVLPISYPGYVYAAGVSWQVENNQKYDIQKYLNDSIFYDRNAVAGGLLLELGRYYHLERSSIMNSTYTNYLLANGLISKEELQSKMAYMSELFAVLAGGKSEITLDYQYEAMVEWVKAMKLRMEELQLEAEDGEIVAAELKNTLRLIEQGISLHRYIHKIDLTDETEFLLNGIVELQHTINAYERIWLLRNREGGLSASTKRLYALLNQYKERLAEQQTLI